MTGAIPAELGGLTNLEGLELGSNQLTGPIAAELGDLSKLRILDLRSNQLTGPIPVGLGELTNMEWLGLRGNELTGPIPARLGELIDLQSLWLSDNQLTGCVPAGLRDVASNDLGELDLPDCDEDPQRQRIPTMSVPFRWVPRNMQSCCLRIEDGQVAFEIGSSGHEHIAE